MFAHDFPILIQPANPGFIVHVCAMNGRPIESQRPLVCADLDEVVRVVRDLLTHEPS